MSVALLAALAAFTPTPVAEDVFAERLTSLAPQAQHQLGAVLFADISGFTAITEALAVQSRKRGQDGSEELSSFINRYLTRMIDLLEDYGGQIVKLSGDAIMACFVNRAAAWGDTETDQAHWMHQLAAQATRAAIAMQQAMHEFERVDTSVGQLRLGLKIGIGVGQMLAVHVGGERRRWEYVLTGDAVLQAVQSQAAASSGMVILAPPAAALVDPSTAMGQSSVIWNPDYQSDLALLELEPMPAASYASSGRVTFAWEQLSPARQTASERLLRAYVPASIARSLETNLAVWLAELRRITVMFVGVQGIDYNHTDALDRLQTIVATIQRITYHYEGSLNKVLYDDKGTVIMLLFGAPPLSHEDDPQRALGCAFEIQQAAQAWPAESVSIGITTDNIFAGPMGSATRREYTVMGDGVNLAARLMQVAGAGETLGSERTYLEARNVWNLEPLPQLKVKGKTEVIRPYRFEGERLRGAIEEGVPLVGRSREIATLNTILRQVEQGRGRILSLVGESGIGKTRLMNEVIQLMRERGSPTATLRGVAESVGQQTPYLVWREILTDYFGLLNMRNQAQRASKVVERVIAIDPELEPRLPLLNDILDLELPETATTRSLTPRQRRDSLAFLIVQLLLAYTQGNVLLLLLDDMQWADSLSWELVLDVARVVGLRPVLLMLGYRPMEHALALGESEPSNNIVMQELLEMPMHQTIELAPLEREAVIHMVSAGFDNLPLAPELLHWLSERGQGNPLFIEETVKVLREQDTVIFDEQQHAWHFASAVRMHAVPPTLKGVIQTRLDRLAPSVQFTCKVAAVIGRVFSERALQAIYPLADEVPRIPEHLAELASLEITPLEALLPERRYQFKSALMQEVAYSSLLHTQRQVLHQAVAEWYEREHADDLDAIAPLLADHYGATEQWKRFLFFAERAGQLALRRYANSEALNYFDRAIEVLRREDTLRGSAEYQRRLFFLLLQRAEVYELTNAYAQHLRDLRELEQIATNVKDVRWQAQVQVAWARYYHIRNRYDDSEQVAMAALRLAQRSSDWQLSGQSMILLARSAALRGDYRKALDWALQGYNDARLANDQQAQANALDFLGLAHMQLGEYDRAERYFRQALHLRHVNGDQWGEGESLMQLGNLAERLGQPRVALEYHQQALTLLRSVGNRRGEAESLRSIGTAYQALGDLGVAQEFLHTARAISEAIGDTYGEAVLLASMGGISNVRADFKAAHKYAERSLQLARRLGNRHVEAQALNVLGNATRGLGDYATAYELHSHAYTLAHELELRRQSAYALHHLGEWMWHTGDYAAAVAYWDQAAGVREAIGETAFQQASRARQAHALARLGDTEAARHIADQVWATWGITPPPGEDEDELREGYLALYETWHYLHEPERAATALAWAYQAVQDRVVRISNPMIRTSFLQQVAINTAILATWQQVMNEA